MGKRIAILAVGKLKSGFWKQAAEHYREKIAKYYYLQETVIRDAPGHLSPEDRAGRESAELRKKCGPRDTIICLDQRGTALTSEEFAAQLRQWLEGPNTPCFLLGGAFGLSRELFQAAEDRLSLSHLTLPHELSRILLLEQIYRAATINWGHPYHH
ncbi:MAG: 23S rRNA (pseudouridine(1915)-N(3))-methyltransferase RlmH [Desulfohalobiaceae bacterium]|nr:23S rRNA (pseudouridine(1915)-N(3))-methyltransferase RlmH [Desulfohalobiaceae bacterium]